MTPYYIKSTDEAALWDALALAGLAMKQYDLEDPLNQNTDNQEDFTPTGSFTWVKTDGYDLDIIGTIFKPTGETGEDENGEYEIVEPIDGYHANLRLWDGELSEEQLEALPLIEAPDSPVRVWAGD